VPSLLLLACLVDQRFVNVRNDSSASNGSLQRISPSGKHDCKQVRNQQCTVSAYLDETVQLFISSNG